MVKGERRIRFLVILIFSLTAAVWASPAGAVFGPKAISEQTRECVECHKDVAPVINQQWGASKHYRANVGCFECHQAGEKDTDAFDHYGHNIAIIVTPKDCARCHEKEVSEFQASHHSKGARILGSLDNRLAEVIEGNRMMVTPGFPEGVSAAVVNGCWQCHGSEVKVLEGGKLDPATWPNTGIGRINPDGSDGSCSACHSRHKFSVEQARNPENCGKCHMGPDHPQLEIYEESKHGIAFTANKHKMNLDNEKWILGEDYNAAPTCATCHMSATPTQGVTHDVGMRISWNNRPAISIRPEIADEKMGLSGKNVDWKKRRQNMKDVCLNCHAENYVDNFYTQYDSLIALYHEKFAKPGQELMALVKPLISPVEFANKIDFIWYEIWHHEGRRARHGASMMGPDYTQWHGMYEVAKNFYAEFIPELQEIAEQNLHSGDAVKKEQVSKLKAKIEEVLNSKDHQWYINKMDPQEAAEREAAQKAFQERYKKE
ncbi:MAG TPA: hydroxylamine oxidoreductase [Candidatus Omnitrophica bacterium]|nr:hydroxylamine oxidoreductase [Candidatus Omnitrophota bacterium]